MSEILQQVVYLTLSAIGVVALVWLAVWAVRSSDDPPRMIAKGLATAALVGGEVFLLHVLKGNLQEEAGLSLVNLVMALMMAGSVAACGIILSIMWTSQISDFLLSPLTDLFDGGKVPPEPRPFYSIAIAKRKQNRPLEAVMEIRKQLDRFPDDYEGINLLASVQAEDLKDLPEAEMTLNEFCDRAEAPPKQVAAALTQMADWHLKLAQDTAGARAALEKIIARFPGTDMAVAAAQRIAHLGGTEKVLLAARDRQPVIVPEGAKSIGLRATMKGLVPEETDPRMLAGELVKHLAQHPLDAEAREQLAVIYATHYHRLDLAAGELNQLADTPGQPARSVALWLNHLADLQVHNGADYEAVRPTLEKIIARFPGTAAAELARSRLAHLRLEIKGQKETPGVKPGVYEQNIGLKYGSPH